MKATVSHGPRDDQSLVVMGAGIIGLGVVQCIRARSPSLRRPWH